MKVDKSKVFVAMADAELSPLSLKSVSRSTFYRAINGSDLCPATVGRLAKELGVKAADLILFEDRR